MKVEGGVLRLRVQAPPVEGAANGAVIAYLAGLLKRPKNTIEVIKGMSSRNKAVRVKGVKAKDVLDVISKLFK